MRSNKRDELTTNSIANAVLDRQQERCLIDCFALLIKRPVEVVRPNLIHPNWGSKMDEANPMIMPKLVSLKRTGECLVTLASPNPNHTWQQEERLYD